MDSLGTPDSVRFGPFAVDLRRRELRKHGRRIRLSQQPFEVLVALLEAPGAIVTREALRNRLSCGFISQHPGNARTAPSRHVDGTLKL